jgi:hypothetical protein
MFGGTDVAQPCVRGDLREKPRRRLNSTVKGHMKKAVVALVFVLSMVLVAEVSARLAMKGQLAAFEARLSQMQGELALRHLQRYSELESNLMKGCQAAVLEKLKISVAIESMLLSSLMKEHQDGGLSQYVARYAPGLAEKLVGYKNPYGTSWKEPPCE